MSGPFFSYSVNRIFRLRRSQGTERQFHPNRDEVSLDTVSARPKGTHCPASSGLIPISARISSGIFRGSSPESSSANPYSCASA